jgi:4,5-DOPA dioxygenase extradiol
MKSAALTTTADRRCPDTWQPSVRRAPTSGQGRRTRHRTPAVESGGRAAAKPLHQHGAPMLLEMSEWMTRLHSWARALPNPNAILVISAHWESAPLTISSTAARGLVYDFRGFDPMYSTMRYDTLNAG